MSPFVRVHTTSCSTLIETASILCCFRDIASYLLKVDAFKPLYLHLAPPYGLPGSNFAEICGIRKRVSGLLYGTDKN